MPSKLLSVRSPAHRMQAGAAPAAAAAAAAASARVSSSSDARVVRFRGMPRHKPLAGPILLQGACRGAKWRRRSSEDVAGKASPMGSSIWDEAIEPRQPINKEPGLYNDDFAPTTAEQRTFRSVDLLALWVGLVVSVPSYCLASSLVQLGMSWWQGVLNIFISNVLVLVPMVLTAHPGTKYGIPFPVLTRASFGIRGANVPSVLRALVACGWFGIQTWVGGSSMHTLLERLAPALVSADAVSWLGIKASEFGCFLAFWAIQVAIILEGVECIRLLETYSAPVLIGLSVALLAWAVNAAGGFGPMLAAPSQFGPGAPQAGQFWAVFIPSLTANVGYWATLSLNIPDFSRYARSQRDQLIGQAVGLPFFMAAFTFVGLAVTSATVGIFGIAISDPVELVARLSGPGSLIAALLGLMLATLSTNIAANVVAPANAFVNLAPQVISFRTGGLITAALGAVIFPWKLIASTQGYIFTWLIGYSALLGPVGGIMLTDYFLLRGRKLDVDALYSSDRAGKYWYRGGYNIAALVALAAGVLPNVPGFLEAAGAVSSVPAVFDYIYSCAWFVGFSVSSVSYALMMRGSTSAKDEEEQPVDSISSTADSIIKAAAVDAADSAGEDEGPGGGSFAPRPAAP